MTNARMVAPRIVALALAAGFSASAQSVVSTHSGLVYFFVGSAFLGNEPLEQKFGRFPDIGEGGELRTTAGRAEVLLTPGSSSGSTRTVPSACFQPASRIREWSCSVDL